MPQYSVFDSTKTKTARLIVGVESVLSIALCCTLFAFLEGQVYLGDNSAFLMFTRFASLTVLLVNICDAFALLKMVLGPWANVTRYREGCSDTIKQVWMQIYNHKYLVMVTTAIQNRREMLVLGLLVVGYALGIAGGNSAAMWASIGACGLMALGSTIASSQANNCIVKFDTKEALAETYGQEFADAFEEEN